MLEVESVFKIVLSVFTRVTVGLRVGRSEASCPPKSIQIGELLGPPMQTPRILPNWGLFRQAAPDLDLIVLPGSAGSGLVISHHLSLCRSTLESC